MPLETATYLNSLNASNPAATDALAQADDHMRLIKAVLLASFPNIAGACSITDVQLTALATALAAGQTLSATGQMAHFARNNAPTGWLSCNGATRTVVTAEVALAQYLGYSGTIGSTYVLPDVVSAGRFLRSFQAGVSSVGDLQAGFVESHTHPFTPTGTVPIDEHGGHAHTITYTQANQNIATAGNGAFTYLQSFVNTVSTPTTTVTTGITASFSPTAGQVTSGYGNGSETRPVNLCTAIFIHI